MVLFAQRHNGCENYKLLRFVLCCPRQQQLMCSSTLGVLFLDSYSNAGHPILPFGEKLAVTWHAEEWHV